MDSPKSPFEDLKFSTSGESAGSEPSSATEMFGKVSTQAKDSLQERNLPRPPFTVETAPTKGSVETATTTPSPHAVQAIESPSPSDPGSFTQMFQAWKHADAPATKIEDAPPASVALPATSATSAPSKQPADLTGI